VLDDVVGDDRRAVNDLANLVPNQPDRRNGVDNGANRFLRLRGDLCGTPRCAIAFNRNDIGESAADIDPQTPQRQADSPAIFQNSDIISDFSNIHCRPAAVNRLVNPNCRESGGGATTIERDRPRCTSEWRVGPIDGAFPRTHVSPFCAGRPMLSGHRRSDGAVSLFEARFPLCRFRVNRIAGQNS